MVSLVRYFWNPHLRKRVTESIGSISVSADPDAVGAYIKLSARLQLVSSDVSTHFSQEDFDIVRAWLLKNGDAHARELRLLRDARIANRVQRELGANGDAEVDVVAQVAASLQRAGQHLKEQAQNFNKRQLDSWSILRPQYLAVYRAWKVFQELANEAGIMKSKADIERE